MKRTTAFLLILLMLLLPACGRKSGAGRDTESGKASEPSSSSETQKESGSPAGETETAESETAFPPDSEPADSRPAESEKSSAPAGDGAGITLSIREDAALKLLSESLADDSPYKIDELHFAEPNLVSITGDLYPKKLSDTYQLGLSALLPETLPFSTSASFTYTPETGIVLTPTSLSVMSLTLPMDFLPASLYKPFADTLNKELQKLPVKVTSITVHGNALVLMG